MTTVNLREIAHKGFSGAILFDGDNSVQIIECDNFYIFNGSFNPQPDGAAVNTEIIFDNSELAGKLNALDNFDMTTLYSEKEERDTFGQGRLLKEILESAKKLNPHNRDRLINELAYGE